MGRMYRIDWLEIMALQGITPCMQEGYQHLHIGKAPNRGALITLRKRFSHQEFADRSLIGS